VHYPGGALVAAQGKGEASFFIIVRGKVKVERYGPEAARLAASDYFGKTLLLVDLPAAATITMLEPCVFLGLHPQSSPSSSRRRLHFAGSLKMHWISE
jgi:CRP-like cAMP-binding protein